MHGPTLVSKPFEIYKVDDENKKISELLKKSRPFVQFELRLGKIYMEIEGAKAMNESPDKLMALDKVSSVQNMCKSTIIRIQ